MGDKPSGTEEDISNIRLSFEAELHLLASDKAALFIRQEQDEFSSIKPTTIILQNSLEDLLIDFYQEAEKLRLKVNEGSLVDFYRELEKLRLKDVNSK